MELAIIRVERGETSGSKSPMWRCQTADGHKVNIFKHIEHRKNTFEFFNEAGYAQYLLAMEVGEIVTWRAHPIMVTVRENGQWLEIEGCAYIPKGAVPDAPPAAPDAALQKIAVQCWAAELLAAGRHVFFWDTETTGLGDDAEIVEIGIVEMWSGTGTGSLVNPLAFSSEAADVTGIAADDLKGAPPFRELYDQLVEVLQGKVWVLWNASFDAGVLERECQRHGLMPILPLATVDAMDMFARWWGEWDAKRQRFTSKSLSFAAEALGLDYPTAHRALADARMTLKVVEALSDLGCGETEDN